MIDIDPNTHINGWYADWLPRTSTHELKRLLGTPYGKDPAVARRLNAELSRRDKDRPAPVPGNAYAASASVKATPDAIAEAVRKRDEPGPEPTGLPPRLSRPANVAAEKSDESSACAECSSRGLFGTWAPGEVQPAVFLGHYK